MMGDFKALLDSDMKVFHNPAEMANMINIWYLEKQYTIPAIVDHTAAENRKTGQIVWYISPCVIWGLFQRRTARSKLK